MVCRDILNQPISSGNKYTACGDYSEMLLYTFTQTRKGCASAYRKDSRNAALYKDIIVKQEFLFSFIVFQHFRLFQIVDCHSERF